MKNILTSEDVNYIMKLVKEDELPDVFFTELLNKLRLATSIASDIENIIKKYEDK